jgi:hypothetical protein
VAFRACDTEAGCQDRPTISVTCQHIEFHLGACALAAPPLSASTASAMGMRTTAVRLIYALLVIFPQIQRFPDTGFTLYERPPGDLTGVDYTLVSTIVVARATNISSTGEHRWTGRPDRSYD